MENILDDSINEIESEDEIIIKQKYVKNKYNKERENSHLPYDEQYFNKYYKDNLSTKVICDVCSGCIAKGHLTRHKKSKKCMKIQAKANEKFEQAKLNVQLINN
jgi:hypothetical protein